METLITTSNRSNTISRYCAVAEAAFVQATTLSDLCIGKDCRKSYWSDESTNVDTFLAILQRYRTEYHNQGHTDQRPDPLALLLDGAALLANILADEAVYRVTWITFVWSTLGTILSVCKEYLWSWYILMPEADSERP